MILELFIAMTLSGSVQHAEKYTNPETAADSAATKDADNVANPVNLLRAGCVSQPDPASTPAESTSHLYIHEVEQKIGCPYQAYADYLLHCRKDKRQSAWRRIVKENRLFFDKSRMTNFEVISQGYQLL